MKRKLPGILFFLNFISAMLFAQVPMYFNLNTGGTNNVFPFGSASSNKVQWTIPANSLGTVGPGNNITVVYFRAGSTDTQTYPNLNIRLKTGTAAGLTGTASLFETGMTTVFAGTNVALTTTAGAWFSFTLTTPFLYDPNFPLLVEAENNATNANGPSIAQSTYTGAGNGRQYGGYGQASFTGSGNSLLHFGIDVFPATPCNAVPGPNTILPMSFVTCASYTNPSLSLANTYSFGGITYQWQSSTVSVAGPFNAIPGATNNTAPSPTLGVTTWFQIVATCTNISNGSTTITPTQFSIASTVVKSVPYIEDFESIPVENRFPNCSWYAPNLGTSVKTYTTATSNNRVPRSGNKFGAFELPSNDNMVYSNGITMSPGITYSAAIHYATNYLGNNNWTSLTLLVGPNQSTTGLVPIATVSPVISGAYKLLSGTFTVSTPGNYYIAIRANGVAGATVYLSFDDFSVTIPCQGSGAINSPTLSVAATSTAVCEGANTNITATGADTYSWNTGASTNSLVISPPMSTNYVVVGTNTLTGCSVTGSQMILVNPLPIISLSASHLTVCAGTQVMLHGEGANNLTWSNTMIGANIAVNPLTTTTYTLVGINEFGCSSSITQIIMVDPLPIVGATSSNNGIACRHDALTFIGDGAITYTWMSSSSSNIYQGNPVILIPGVTTTYTIIGKDAKGCVSTGTLIQQVEECTGIAGFGKAEELTVYPNPTSGILGIDFKTEGKRSIKIFDMTGRIVYSATSDHIHTEVILNELSNGVYHMNITSPDFTQIIKIIKQ